MENESAHSIPANDANTEPAEKNSRNWIFKLLIGVILLVILIGSRWLISLDELLLKLESAESWLRDQYAASPILFLTVAFFVYVVSVGLSLPIATFLSLAYAWLFTWTALPLLSLASTCGATLAFLSARYLLKDWVQDRFEKYLKPINKGFEDDGAWYIITLRMIAFFPFFAINLVLGLVPVRTWTFFWASMLGMFPMTFAFVYLGMQIPSIEDVREEGLGSIISLPIVLGIALVGVLPILLKWVIRRRRND